MSRQCIVLITTNVSKTHTKLKITLNPLVFVHQRFIQEIKTDARAVMYTSS